MTLATKVLLMMTWNNQLASVLRVATKKPCNLLNALPGIYVFKKELKSQR